jgi:Flp pilus assembly protein TadG
LEVAVKKSLRKNNQGAVLAEFMVAILPMLLCFFVFTQIAHLYTANLVFKHAANVAARATVVITQKDLNPGKNGEEGDITDAAKAALGPWNAAFSNVSVSHTQAGEQYGIITTTTTATFTCAVPMGRQIVCPGGTRTMTQAVALPLQGARYTEEE